MILWPAVLEHGAIVLVIVEAPAVHRCDTLLPRSLTRFTPRGCLVQLAAG